MPDQPLTIDALAQRAKDLATDIDTFAKTQENPSLGLASEAYNNVTLAAVRLDAIVSYSEASEKGDQTSESENK